jgi:hypothetical protein
MRAKTIAKDYYSERIQELSARASLGVTLVPPPTIAKKYTSYKYTPVKHSLMTAGSPW